jgi:hypothetical protein
MRKFTVDPVPTPSTLPGSTNSSAARAAACFPVFCELIANVRKAGSENDTARFEAGSVFEFEAASEKVSRSPN